MSSAIHYKIIKNDGTHVTGSYWDDGFKRAPGLESLVEGDRETLLEIQKGYNTKIEQLETEAHRQFGRFDWDRSFTGVDYTGDNGIALLLFHTVVDASKRLPHLTFEFHDSYYFNVLYRINKGQLVALPEIEIDGELWAWDGLKPEQRNPHLDTAKKRFSYLSSLDPMQDSVPHETSTRRFDFYYVIQDAHINPSFVFENKGPRFLTVHHSNPEDIAKNGKSNFDNLGEAIAAIREGISEIRGYLESQDMSGVGGSEGPYEVSEAVSEALGQFEQLLDGEKPEEKKSGLHKYRIELIIHYTPKHEEDLHKVVHRSPHRFNGECIYIATADSTQASVRVDCRLGIQEATKEMNILSSNVLRHIKGILEEYQDLEWYQVDLTIHH